MSTTGAATLYGATTKLYEKSRTYDFAEREVTLHDVVELVVRPSGTHRLKTKDGSLHIINTGWLAIHIVPADGEGWTV